MPACATRDTIADQSMNGKLFLPVPDTDFRDYLDEVDDLLRFAPEIINGDYGIAASTLGEKWVDQGLFGRGNAATAAARGKSRA